VSTERETILSLLQFQRESLVRNMSGVDEAAVRESPVPSGTTLLWLMQHMARAESLWIVQRFAGTRDEIADEDSDSDDTMAAAIATYRRTWERVDAIIDDTASLDELCRNLGDDTPLNLRWVLLHLLEETARHAGHADILRELIDGETGR
jgi:uncharacterized damage-inducible protein DinB